MKSFQELFGEARYVSSADYQISRTGRKVHKMKKIADTDYVDPKDEEELAAEKEKEKIDLFCTIFAPFRSNLQN